MKAKKSIHLEAFVLLILFGTILGCTHQEVVNSPCTSLNATVDIKPRADLALAFGNDAIEAAVKAVVKGFTKGAITSVPNLTDSGKNAALRTAKAAGRNPSPTDISELEKYLARDLVPSIKQNPACNFTVSSVGKAYVGIEAISFITYKDKQIPELKIKNTGQIEANCHFTLKLIIGGKRTSASTDFRLGPSQERLISFANIDLPMADIKAGKTSLFIAVVISYPQEAGGPLVTSEETYQYDHNSRYFSLASQN